MVHDSKLMTDESQSLETGFRRDPKALSPEYHKAHKQVMLWSTVLFVWEFVGIDLEKAKDAEGYAGAVIRSLKSPQAVPWVLLLVVLYFLFKCSVEWAQCHVDRRRIVVARIDYISALVVSAAAIALYFGQSMSSVQVADLVSSQANVIFSVFYGLVAGTFIGAGIQFTRTEGYWKGSPNWARRVAALTMWLGSLLVMVMAFLFRLNWVFFFISVIIGVPILRVNSRLFRRIRTSKRISKK